MRRRGRRRRRRRRRGRRRSGEKEEANTDRQTYNTIQTGRDRQTKKKNREKKGGGGFGVDSITSRSKQKNQDKATGELSRGCNVRHSE